MAPGQEEHHHEKHRHAEDQEAAPLAGVDRYPPTRGTVVESTVIQVKEAHVGAAMRAQALRPEWTTWGLQLAADTKPGIGLPALLRLLVRYEAPKRVREIHRLA